MGLSQKEIALKYIERGIPVFPCKPSNKAPLIKGGFTNASSDRGQVETWWGRYPNALIGSPHDAFVVIDIDDYDLDSLNTYIVGQIKERLFDEVFTDDMPKVRTMSGGTHVYIRNDSTVQRSLKTLPQVDILGIGGYVILPDQRNYVCTTHDDPWNICDHLHPANMVPFNRMVKEFEPMAKELRSALKKHRRDNTTRPGHSVRMSETITPKLAEVRKKQAEKFDAMKSKTDRPLAYVDYELNTITYEVPETVYSACRPDREEDIKLVDGVEQLIGEDETLLVQPPYDSETINRLFHNQQVQRRLGKLLGLKVPLNLDAKTAMRSILPGHVDETPSMGVRWNSAGTHLLIRDFANHFGDKFEQTDYNIVRLYAVRKYGTNIPKLSSVEFVVWFTRMLWEANLIDIDQYKKQYRASLDKLTKAHRTVAERFLDLDATRRMYKGYSGETVFADKFCAAWCGVSVSTANRAKKSLQEKGIIEKCGEYDCNPGRDDGFFKTALFRAIANEEESEDMKLNEAFDLRNLKFRKTIGVQEQVDTEAEKDVRDRYPDMATVVGLEIDEHHRQVIKNFADDFDLEGVPEPGNMFVPILLSPVFEEINLPDPHQVKTFELSNFVLEVVEGMNDPSRIILVARAESEAISEYADELSENAENVLEDREEVFFVVAKDIDSDEFDSDGYDLDYLTLKFNEYVEKVSGSELFIRHMHEDHAMLFLDGDDFGTDD